MTYAGYILNPSAEAPASVCENMEIDTKEAAADCPELSRRILKDPQGLPYTDQMLAAVTSHG